MMPSSDSEIESNPAGGIPAIVFVMIGLFLIDVSQTFLHPLPSKAAQPAKATSTIDYYS